MSYVFDSTDFKRYLIDCSPRYRVDGLSVWVNAIPLPVDLFDKMFDDALSHFQSYLDHVIGAILLRYAINENFISGILFSDFPSASIIRNSKASLEDAFEEVLMKNFDTYQRFASEVSEYLGIGGYEIQIHKLMIALSHQGKKYSRIYCPVAIKEKIRRFNPELFSDFAKSNGDMFGNVIADGLGIYRSGFNDALANIFNKLLDFKIYECSGVLTPRPKITLVSHVDAVDANVAERCIFERTSDGALWEPLFDGEYKVKINSVHPYAKKLPEYDEKTKNIYELLLKLAEYEAQLSDDRDLKSIGSMRSVISRTLWIENNS